MRYRGSGAGQSPCRGDGGSGRRSIGGAFRWRGLASMGISAQTVKELREMTGAGMMDCKKALEQAGGDLQKAISVLREQGLAKAAKKAERTASEGLIYAYIHPGDKLGVLLEINCETDFVARTDDFRQLAKDLSTQIAATKP